MADDWVEVRSCTFMHEALFLQSVLDGSGIEAMIPNEHTIGINPLWTNLLGGIRVMVRPADVARASELLNIATAPSGNEE